MGALSADSRVRAAWLEGSLGRGHDADRYSDVDLHLLLDPATAGEFRAGLEALLSGARPLLFYRSLIFDPLVAMVMFDDCLHLEVWVHPTDCHSVTAGRATILFDPHGTLAVRAPTETDAAAVNRALEQRLEDFWFGVSHTAKAGRGELIAATHGLSHQAEYLADVMMFGRGGFRTVGMGRINQYLDPEVRGELERILALPELSRLSLARAHLALADLMREVGRKLAAERGVVYPEALETAVLRYVHRELEAQGLWAP